VSDITKSPPDEEIKNPADRRKRKLARVKRPRVNPEPWERHLNEPEKAFAAFEVYRDLGEERSLRRTAIEKGLAQRTVEYYAQRYVWTERVLAYDNYMTRAAIIKRRKGVEAMQERHVNTAMLMQNRIIQRLNTVRPDELSIDQLGKWFDLAVKVERQARGELDQPLVQVNVGEQQHIAATAAGPNPLADYLEKHPDRIPAIMPLVERFLGGDNGALADIEKIIGNGRGSASGDGVAGLLGSGDGPVRSPDLGDVDSGSEAPEGGAAGLRDAPVPS
jgi:hypothetical protein